jgi:Domain of unknown function (DUF4440)
VATTGKSTTHEPDATPPDREAWESAAVATLHRLNAESIRAHARSDTAWLSEHLHAGYVCTLVDGHRINKEAVLRRAQEQPPATAVGCDDVDVHLLNNDVALVHGVIHYRSADTIVLLRYMTVWQAEPRRWRAVATQFTPIDQAQPGTPFQIAAGTLTRRRLLTRARSLYRFLGAVPETAQRRSGWSNRRRRASG